LKQLLVLEALLKKESGPEGPLMVTNPFGGLNKTTTGLFAVYFYGIHIGHLAAGRCRVGWAVTRHRDHKMTF
jgi:hypothetical protein